MKRVICSSCGARYRVVEDGALPKSCSKCGKHGSLRLNVPVPVPCSNCHEEEKCGYCGTIHAKHTLCWAKLQYVYENDPGSSMRLLV